MCSRPMHMHSSALALALARLFGHLEAEHRAYLGIRGPSIALINIWAYGGLAPRLFGHLEALHRTNLAWAPGDPPPHNKYGHLYR